MALPIIVDGRNVWTRPPLPMPASPTCPRAAPRAALGCEVPGHRRCRVPGVAPVASAWWRRAMSRLPRLAADRSEANLDNLMRHPGFSFRRYDVRSTRGPGPHDWVMHLAHPPRGRLSPNPFTRSSWARGHPNCLGGRRRWAPACSSRRPPRSRRPARPSASPRGMGQRQSRRSPQCVRRGERFARRRSWPTTVSTASRCASPDLQHLRPPPAQRRRAAVPTFIGQAMAGEPITVHGDGSRPAASARGRHGGGVPPASCTATGHGAGERSATPKR